MTVEMQTVVDRILAYKRYRSYNEFICLCLQFADSMFNSDFTSSELEEMHAYYEANWVDKK